MAAPGKRKDNDMSEQDKEVKDQSKKVYNRPSLIFYSSLKDLTHGGSGGDIESGGGMSKWVGKGVTSRARP
jgi:hypothetical protein